ncbi:alpha/beta hydrolase [Nocardioides sp. SYSU D00038]|uniref:alpha/beta hydrolase n=1 Tax=Nocardioides sp. SYSU D00038 TaxID=2812554 RepID=UPI00196859D4|nr:alpha/beta hydrolase [Nocardioides sp. SYSU D00038]
MALFPESRRALEQSADDVPVWTEGYDVAAARATAREAALGEPREDVAEVVDLDADGVPVRLYRPAGARPGVMVHAHGGGFVFHDVEVHDPACRRLANRTGLAVVSVDYRRPPEHPFPAAPDDLSTVVGWLDRAADEHGLAGPAYVHGDSAGANLALVAALRHPGRFAAAVLIYPFLDPEGGFPSYAATGNGFDPREAAWYWEQYAGGPDDLVHPDLAPLRSTRLGTLPPTLVVTAEHDPLVDEAEELARRLAEEGVEVVSARYQGQLHGFWRHPSEFPAAEVALRQVAGFLAVHGG